MDHIPLIYIIWSILFQTILFQIVNLFEMNTWIWSNLFLFIGYLAALISFVNQFRWAHNMCLSRYQNLAFNLYFCQVDFWKSISEIEKWKSNQFCHFCLFYCFNLNRLCFYFCIILFIKYFFKKLKIYSWVNFYKWMVRWGNADVISCLADGSKFLMLLLQDVETKPPPLFLSAEYEFQNSKLSNSPDEFSKYISIICIRLADFSS